MSSLATAVWYTNVGSFLAEPFTDMSLQSQSVNFVDLHVRRPQIVTALRSLLHVENWTHSVYDPFARHLVCPEIRCTSVC